MSTPWNEPPPGGTPPAGWSPPGHPAWGPPPGWPGGPPADRSNSKGLTGFITGLLGLIIVGGVPLVGLVLSVVGICFSATGMGYAKRTGAQKGLAVAGLVCGIIGTLLFLAYVASLGQQQR